VSNPIWVTPKVTWTSSEGVSDADLNRIEGNSKYMKAALDRVGATDGMLTTGGAANVYTLTTPIPVAPLTAGMPFQFKMHATNTGPSTISIDGLGAVAIVKGTNVPLSAGDLPAGFIVDASYDGTNIQITPSYEAALNGARIFVTTVVTPTIPAMTSVNNDVWFDLYNATIKIRSAGSSTWVPMGYTYQ
jgi:hypothetical protein